jgi:hypothetical protein
MYKVSSADPRVPRRDPPSTPKGRAQYPASDFSLNPVSLQLIGAALEQASGLTIDTLFLNRREQFEATAVWAISKVAEGLTGEEAKELLTEYLEHFKRTMKKARLLDGVHPFDEVQSMDGVEG